MTIVLNGTTGITNDGGYTGDGISFADTTPANTLVTDTSGNVGIGTSSPTFVLDVSKAAQSLGKFENTTGTNAFIRLKDTARSFGMFSNNGAWGVYDDNAGAERMRIDSSGYLYVAGVYNGTTGSAANVHVTSSGALFRSTSSLKYKSDVQNATHGLNEVMQLRPVTYKGKSENDGETVFGGLIAEEVHEAGLTEFVQYADDGTPDALAYGNMVALAFKAIQEQQAIITDLKSRIETLEAK